MKAHPEATDTSCFSNCHAQLKVVWLMGSSHLAGADNASQTLMNQVQSPLPTRLPNVCHLQQHCWNLAHAGHWTFS